jgi:tRNA (mo5U34)-methyltransferase
METIDVQDQIEKLKPWFHNLHLPDGIQTAPDHPLGDFPRFKWRRIAQSLPTDIKGWKVLDIGCNAGFYTFELARGGASVVGIDVDEKYLRQARWAARRLNLESRTSFKQMTIYHLARELETYDLVVFMGVFYHLRYPLLGLDIAARKVRKLMLFQSLTVVDRPEGSTTTDFAKGLADLHNRDALAAPGWPRMAFVEGEFAGDPTNWWIPNQNGLRAMLRSAGLRVIAEPDDETFLCEPDPDRPISPFAEADFRAVIGMP